MLRKSGSVPTGFVAINAITCKPEYCERFERLFCSRAHAIDEAHGFIRMKVLKPCSEGGAYMVMSEWDCEKSFREWAASPAFKEGHRRGFEDLALAKARGEEPPMKSEMTLYTVLSE